MKKSKIFWIIISVVLGVSLILGGAYIFTNGNLSGGGSLFEAPSVSTFYLTINGKKISDHSDGYSLSPDMPLDVDVSFPFEKIDPTSKGYSIKIIPSGKVNFEFAVGTVVHTVVSESDLTSMFSIDKQEDSFSISSDKTFEELFEDLYPGETVYVDLSTLTAANLDMFRIVATSGDGSVITIDFAYAILPDSISIDSEVIVF